MSNKYYLLTYLDSRANREKPIPGCQTILEFAAARDDRDGGGHNWNSKISKASVKSPSPKY